MKAIIPFNKLLFFVIILFISFALSVTRSYAQPPVFYGLTEYGGTDSLGTLYKFDPTTGQETVLINFKKNKEHVPTANFVYNPNNGLLYATSVEAAGYTGGGTIFTFDPVTGKDTVIWNFGKYRFDNGVADGFLVFDSTNGMFYGTSNDFIYSFNPSTNRDSLLYQFSGYPTDGMYPSGPMVFNPKDGLFYLITGDGAYGYGAIISFDPATNKETVRYNFANRVDAVAEFGGRLVYDAVTGLFYGTTNEGGAYNFGTIFSFDPVTNEEQVLQSLGTSNRSSNPIGQMVYNPGTGLFYGTTSDGGAGSEGSIFSFNPATGKDSTLFSCISIDTSGRYIACSLAYDNSNGLYYGVAGHGGTYNDGIIFAFNPLNSKFHKLWSFGNGKDGIAPLSSLTAYTFDTTHNTIATGTVSPTVFCAGTTVSVPYTSTGKFNAGNTFTVQLSYANGNFGAATNIGTLKSTASSGTINVNIPAGTHLASGYRLRVISSNPIVRGSDNGSNLTIDNFPSTSVTSISICKGTNGTLRTTGATTYKWAPSTGLNETTGASVFTSPTVNTTYTVTGSNSCGASAATSIVKVNTTADIIALSTDNTITSNSFKLNWTISGNSNYNIAYSGPSAGSLNNVIPPQTISGLKSGGLYYVTVTQNTASCASTGYASVPLNPVNYTRMFATTLNGGGKGPFPGVGAGTIFVIDPVADTLKQVHAFGDGKDAQYPYGNLVVDPIDTLLYGMSSGGGTNGLGTIYWYNPFDNSEKVVWNFAGGTDGSTPHGDLVYNPANGLFYGMTMAGGTNGKGVIFSFNPGTNSESVLWSLGGGTDGQSPQGNLVYNSNNELFYGMTAAGGSKSAGAIITFNPATNAENVVWNFAGKTLDGKAPHGNLVYFPPNGLFYGMTSRGGANDSGTIFTFNAVTNADSLVWSFGADKDAAAPNADLIYDGTFGLFYGTSVSGGYSHIGSIFSYDPFTNDFVTNKESVLWSGNTSEGENLCGNLIYNAFTKKYYTTTEKDAISHLGQVIRFDEYDENGFDDWMSSGNASSPCGSFVNYSSPYTVGRISGCSTTSSSICAGAQISVNYTATGIFKPDNVFSAELSDNGGGWYPLVIVGTLKSTVSGVINATIPANTLTGKFYRLRILSSNPIDTSPKNTFAINISGGNDAPYADPANLIGLNNFTAFWGDNGSTNYYLDVSLHSDFSTFVTGFNNLSVGNVTRYAVNNLAPGTTYYYRVRSNNNCGISGNSAVISVTTTYCSALAAGTITPASTIICAGTTQTLTLAGSSGGTLQWQLSTDNVNWANVSSNGNASTYTTQSADGNSKKYYRCLSSNACYNAASTSAVVDVSSPNIAVAATGITNNTATVNWNPVGSGNYSLKYSGAGTGVLTTVTPPKMLSGLLSGGTYNVTITQTTPVGCTASGLVTFTTLCAVPTNLQVTATTSNSISLLWTAPAGNYRVYYTQLFSASHVTLTKDVTGATSTTLSSLLPGATYQIYVSSLNCGSAVGQPSGFVIGTTTTTTTCSGLPIIDSVRTTCSSQLKVWLHGSASNQYKIYLQAISPVMLAANSYSITSGVLSVNVLAGQTFLIGASSVCSGVLSNVVVWPQAVAVPPACNAVNNLLLSQLSCVGFTASWNADNCTSSTLTSYLLSLRKQGTIAWNTYSVLPTTTFKAVNWLVPGNTYQCYIRSAYNCGTYVTYGPASQTQTVTTASQGCRTEEESIPEEIPAPVVTSGNSVESFSLYPNPNTGEFVVDFSRLNLDEEQVRIEVRNVLGQNLLTQITSVADGHLNEFINMPAGAASGIYFVRLIMGNKVYNSEINISK